LCIYLFLYPLSLYILGKSKLEDGISFKDSMMIGSTEYFFNGITPFSSGGQPFQVYAYSQIGVKLYRSTGIILINFVASQLSIVILCLLSLFYYEKLTMDVVYLKVMIIVGLVMNVFILTFFTVLGVSKTIRKWIIRFVNWLFHLKIFKGKLDKAIVSFENYCDGAQKTFKALITQKLKFFLCVLFKLLAFIVFYTIPFFILKSLSIEVVASDLALIIAMTTFSIAMSCYIPTPGAAGGIEFAFQSLFVTILPQITQSVAVSGVLLWRLITYYLVLVFSLIIYIIFEANVQKKNKKKIKIEEERLENA
ncbi:MAG: flippase-like domain-containing protein, partial [Anaeroplasmataceae bacterium]|nr:flippase-like domain-containing protein [Anaeroplasmataceae bacterium]